MSVFLSHNWGEDIVGKDNHERVAAINKGLQDLGMTTWFDGDKMDGDIASAMIHGIDQAEVVVVFLTTAYMAKVTGANTNDNCYKEFGYSIRTKSAAKMIAVPMETATLDPNTWKGIINMELGGRLYKAQFSDADCESKDAKFGKHLVTLFNEVNHLAGLGLPTPEPPSSSKGNEKEEKKRLAAAAEIERKKADAEIERKKAEEERTRKAVAKAVAEEKRVAAEKREAVAEAVAEEKRKAKERRRKETAAVAAAAPIKQVMDQRGDEPKGCKTGGQYKNEKYWGPQTSKMFLLGCCFYCNSCAYLCPWDERQVYVDPQNLKFWHPQGLQPDQDGWVAVPHRKSPDWVPCGI